MSDDSSIREQLSVIIAAHTQSDEYGYPVEDCNCGDDRDGTETWAAHLALVIATELGLTREDESHAGPFILSDPRHRWVTDWERL